MNAAANLWWLHFLRCHIKARLPPSPASEWKQSVAPRDLYLCLLHKERSEWLSRQHVIAWWLAFDPWLYTFSSRVKFFESRFPQPPITLHLLEHFWNNCRVDLNRVLALYCCVYIMTRDSTIVHFCCWVGSHLSFWMQIKAHMQAFEACFRAHLLWKVQNNE